MTWRPGSSPSAQPWKDVGDYEVSCLTERGWMNGQPSSFRFHVPRSLVFEPSEREQLVELIRFCQERLSPFHGHAGLTAVSTYDETEWEPEKLDLATRYQTLYIDDRISEIAQASRGLWNPNLGFQYDDPEGEPNSEVVLMPGDVAPYQLSLGPHGELLKREAVSWELRAEL